MPFSGNAIDWDDKARAASYAVDQTPAKGAVAQWNTGVWGHVAYVEDVTRDASGKITKVKLSEYNWSDSNGDGIYGNDGTYGTREVAATSVENYIHFKDLPTSGDTVPPGIPGSITAQPQYDLQVRLSWRGSIDNVGVTGYRVYRNNTYVGASTSTSYIDTPPTQGTRYVYTVTAYDAANNQSGAGTVSVTLPDYARGDYRGDFNGDGKSDIVSLGIPGNGSDLVVWLSNGLTFSAPAQWAHMIGWDWNTLRVLTGDFNGDGKTDVLTHGQPGDGSDFQVFLSSGIGFQSPQQWWHGTAWWASGMKTIAGDFNGDGKTDIASLGVPGDGSDLIVWLSTGTGFTVSRQWWHGVGWDWNGMRVVAGDFNGDGKCDVASIGVPGDGADIVVFLSTGSSFGSGTQWQHMVGWPWSTMRPIVGDFNGDGKTDIANLGVPGDGSDLMVFVSTGLSFHAPAQWAHMIGWDWNTLKGVAGDFSGDGKTDVATLGQPGSGSDLTVFVSTSNSFIGSQWWAGSAWDWNGMKIG